MIESNDRMSQPTFECECGDTSYSILRARFRIVCHCRVCQRFNDSSYGDTLVLRKADLGSAVPTTVTFDTYRPPPNIQRGVCRSCRNPAIEIFDSRVLPSIVMVPRAMHRDHPSLPTPKCHLFYEHRIVDVHDGLAKHEGYLRSQFAFGRHLFGSM